MSRHHRLERSRVAVYLGIFVVASGVWIAGAQQAPANAQGSNFTGGTVTTLKPEARPSYYIFGPGGRTKWHIHEGGQLLLVEEGRGRTQIRGQQPMDLRPGETTFSPPGASHWHGSAPNESAKLFQVSRGQTTWQEAVDDRDYTLPPKR